MKRLEKRVRDALRDREAAVSEIDKAADDFAALTNRVVRGIKNAMDLLEDPRPRNKFEVKLERIRSGGSRRRATRGDMDRARELVVGLAEVTAAEQDPDGRRDGYLSFHDAVGKQISDLLATLEASRIKLTSSRPSDRIGDVIRGRYAEFEKALDDAQDAWSKISRDGVERTYERVYARYHDADSRAGMTEGMPADLLNWLGARNDFNMPPGRPNAAERRSRLRQQASA